MADQERSAKPERTLTDEQKKTLRTARVVKEMMATPGWQVYKTVLEYHLQVKRNEFEQPSETSLDGIAQVLRAESAKGAIMGIRLALELAPGMITAGHNLQVQLGDTPTAGDDE